MTEKTEALHEQEAAHIYRLRDEIMRQEIETAEAAAELRRLATVEAQRDALLEALAVVLLEAEHTLLDATRRKARAAIKAVEEEA